MMLPSQNVDYIASCRRHLKDGHLLQRNGRMANAGQLFGFSVECGLKAVLVRASAPTDGDGSVVRPYREHMPKLWNLITAAQLLPDGRSASLISGYLGTINVMANWSTDHRYWRNGAIPVASISDWELAALEMDDLLDNLTVIGL